MMCLHGLVRGFHVIPKAEGRNDVFTPIITRWSVAPELVIYVSGPIQSLMLLACHEPCPCDVCPFLKFWLLAWHPYPNPKHSSLRYSVGS
jgi:hypothetical protein